MNLYSRTSRILLLVRSIIRALFWGIANKVPKNISNIIVVPTGKLGDVVCTTPVLLAIRTNLPNARIILLGDANLHRGLLSHSNLAVNYINIEDKDVLRQIKKVNADAALITGPSFIPTALLYLSGIPLVVAPKVVGGFSPAETRPYKILQRFIKTFPYRIDDYAPRERLKALESIGIYSNDTKKHLAFSKEALIKAEKLFSQYKDKILVGITPTAGNKIKEWPIARFAEVANYVASKYNAVIVIIGSSNDISYSEKLRGDLNKNVQYIDTTGILSIDELKAFISKLKLFISVDTGPIYIAETFNVPTIDIVGPMDEKEQPPIGKFHKIVVAPRKKSELHTLNSRGYDKEEAEKQVNDITSKMVIDELDLLMKILI